MAKKKTINMVKSQVIYKDYSKDAERTALVSGENLSHMFGKIARWYTDISWVGHTHTEANITDFGTYAGASTKGGAATSANKLNIGSADIGSETKPVYFSYLTGKPVACTYSLNASVPANAVFTDINVKQSPSTADESREVLFAGNTGNTETTGTVGKSNKLYFNPSTGALTATSFSGSLAASNLTGTIDAGRLPTTAVTAGSYGPAAGGTLTYGGTFDVPYVTVDKYGRLTAGSTKTFTMPAQYTHPTYTSKTSGLYKITVDGTGHVSGTAAVTASDLPSHTHPYLPESTLTGSPDLNTYTTSGVYHIATQTATNAPTTNHATLFVDGTVGTKYQLFKPDSVDATWYTRHWDFTNGVWLAWTTLKLTDTVYTHPTYTSKTSGLYKITVDSLGHVSATATVTASDLPAHTHNYLPTTTKYAISDSVGGVALSSYSNHLKFNNEMNFSKLSATGHVWFGYRWDTDGTTESGSDIDLYVTRYKFGNASGNGQLAEVEASSFIGNASSANIPYGFSSRSTSASWTVGGTFVTGWDAGNGCEIAFVKDYPASKQLSCCIDGYFFQNEGKKRVLDEANYSSYVTPAGIGALSTSTKYALSETVGGPAIAATAIKLSHGNEINFSKLGNGYEDIFFGWRWREADGSESSDADAGLNCYHFLKGGGNSAYAAIKAAEFRGNATSATTATTASKLGTNAGNSTCPVYFSGGVPVACKQYASGAFFSIVPFVRSDGVMDIGRYIDFHVTNDATSLGYRLNQWSAGCIEFNSYNANNIVSMYAPSGYNQLRFQLGESNKTYTAAGIIVNPLTTSGSVMRIQCGGNMMIGGGESPTTLYSNDYLSCASSESESLFLSADGSIYLTTSCDTYANRKEIKIDTNGHIIIGSSQSLIQLQNSGSNYTAAIKWWKGGTNPGNYGPEIGQHNTGDTDGSITILPYHTDASPWNGSVGLFISKTRLLYNGTAISLNGHTHSYAGSSTAGGSANRAVQSDNCKVTVTDPSSRTTYGIVFVADPNTTEDNALRKSFSIRMNHFVGAADTEGITELIIGNAVAKSSAGNSSGHLTLYNSNGKWAEIYPDASATVDYKLYLPASTGTLALVGDNNHTHNYVPNTRAGMIAGINLLDTATAAPTDDSYYIAQENNASTTNYYRRKHSALWSYIKSKADSVYAAASHTHSYLPLSGGTLTGYLKLGASDTETLPNCGITVHDIRSVNVPASGFGSGKLVNFYFHCTDTPNSEWWSIMHMKGWTGAYCAWELAGTAHNGNGTSRPLYVRTSNENTAWGSWRKIYDSSNKPTLSELGAASSSHTHTYLIDPGNSSYKIEVVWAGASVPATETDTWPAVFTKYNMTSGMAIRLKESTWDAYKTFLGLGSAAYTASSAYAASSHTHTYIESKANYAFTSSTLPNSFDWGVSAGFVNSDSGFGSYGSVLTVRTYSGGGGTLQLYAPYSPTYGGKYLKARFGNYDSSSGNSWTSLKELAWNDEKLGAKSDGSYYGMTSPALADNVWIRTTSLGIIPYQSGALGSGHNSLGTSSWYFGNIYADNHYGKYLSLGSSSIRGLIEIRGSTSASVSYGSDNPRIRFMNSAADQNIDIVFNDYDSVRAPASLSVHGNQGGEYLLAPNISAWDYTNNKWMAMLSAWSLGTTSVVGQGRVIAGNGTKKGTAGNARGLVEIYSEQDGCVFIIAPPSLTTEVTVTLPSTSGTLELVGHTHSYLPLSGGTLTGNLSLTETKSILLRPNHSSYTAGIGYDTSGNECIGIWAKNTVTRLRWHAGTDMTTMTSGTMMGITPDFEISKASGTAKGYIAGDSIVTYKILWSGSTSCTARSSTSITLTTSISANKYRFIKVVWNCGTYTGISEFRADTLNVTNNIPSGSDATTTNMIQYKIASDGKSVSVGPGTTTITVIQIAGVCVI